MASALAESALRLHSSTSLSAAQREACSALLLRAAAAPSAAAACQALEELHALLARAAALAATNSALLAQGFRARPSERLRHDVASTSVPIPIHSDADADHLRFTSHLSRRECLHLPRVGSADLWLHAELAQCTVRRPALASRDGIDVVAPACVTAPQVLRGLRCSVAAVRTVARGPGAEGGGGRADGREEGDVEGEGHAAPCDEG